MSKRAKFPPIPHVHKATGQERVRYRGRDYYLGKAGSIDAQRRYAELLAHWTRGDDAPPREKKIQLNVEEVWRAFNADAKTTRDIREVNRFRLLGTMICAQFGMLSAERFNSITLLEIQRMMAAKWVRTVVNRQIVRVRTVWRWAESRQLVPPGSWEHLRTVPGLRKNDRQCRQPRIREMPAFATVKRIARECPKLIGRALLLQWWTGARSCEVRMMRPGDIDRRGKVWLYRPATHKGSWRENDAGRVVALGPKCQALLGGLLDGPADSYVFGPPRRGLVRARGHYDGFGYAQVIRRAARRVGAIGFRPYDCRHAAKMRFTRQFGLDAARAMLGQLSLGTTNLYGAAADLETAAKVARLAS